MAALERVINTGVGIRRATVVYSQMRVLAVRAFNWWRLQREFAVTVAAVHTAAAGAKTTQKEDVKRS